MAGGKSDLKKKVVLCQTQRVSLTGSGGEQTDSLNLKRFCRTSVVLSEKPTSTFTYFSAIYSM